MIGISKLYCGTVEASDPLRYERQSDRLPSHLLQFSKDMVDRAAIEMPKWVGTMPEQAVEVVPFEKHEEGTGRSAQRGRPRLHDFGVPGRAMSAMYPYRG